MTRIPDSTANAIEAELKVLIPRDEIARRVRELAQEVEASLAGERLVAVAALTGGFMFLADLIRHIRPAPVVDLAHVRSYGDSTVSSGRVELLRPLDQPIEGRHVLIVEDIIDTGRTARFLLDMVTAQRPAAMSFVTLLDKPARRQVRADADLIGFEIGNHFVVGYGLDYAGLFRAVPDVCLLPEWVEEPPVALSGTTEHPHR